MGAARLVASNCSGRPANRWAISDRRSPLRILSIATIHHPTRKRARLEQMQSQDSASELPEQLANARNELAEDRARLAGAIGEEAGRDRRARPFRCLHPGRPAQTDSVCESTELRSAAAAHDLDASRQGCQQRPLRHRCCHPPLSQALPRLPLPGLVARRTRTNSMSQSGSVEPAPAAAAVKAASTVPAAASATDAVTDEAFVAPSMRSRKRLSFVGEMVATIEERVQAAAATMAVPPQVPEAHRQSSDAATSSSSSSLQAARCHAIALKQKLHSLRERLAEEMAARAEAEAARKAQLVRLQRAEAAQSDAATQADQALSKLHSAETERAAQTERAGEQQKAVAENAAHVPRSL